MDFFQKIQRFYDPRQLIYRHRLLSEMVKKIIVHSEVMKRKLLEYGVSSDRIAVIPHGTLTLEGIKPKSTKSILKIPEQRMVILSFGFIRDEKNEDMLLRVFPEILNQFPDLHLIFAGAVHPLNIESDLPVSVRRREIAERLKVVQNITFIEDFIPDDSLCEIFSAADIFISLYDKDYLEVSGALHLAMGSGLPCVVFRVSRYAEIEQITPETVVEPGNINALKEIILKLLRDDKLRESISQRVLMYARETSWKKVSELHYRLYREVLSRH